ncbi:MULTISPECIES: YetF domain-containing protein [unclassified Paenibacillus]|uniref:DUF421 domain-containing protein n=1 Tax=unclassified Paenibacillus TaxID=185978 RepID=UPI00240711C7|nr:MULTISPECIES: YetF domain-containing protein [unclassified Paenibacillus]MDF9839772.1 uncharacterized membrane protein YcaP (DUF421 family) [Paenibacillus sp. PastF-2]MDF9846352.1 uncharacterized membrane protein YcaP (DUF421 family) [Paenibacillus sp. PastM-2]MDF9853298.1 uncharacterized membrane protein YcaP (DUF421 family) [Paenibacillus sp. PastF-1]MDH6478198.1 uncharacterized membrane protein YcaP (DUF421 family) [Paenibacillus sp. PastH-2]MDH6506303.1 uncharacterized membrane protein 
MFFDTWSDIFRILIIGIISYISLIVMVRLSGKRTLSKMNAFDFTVSVALGSTLSTVILDKQITLAEGLTAFAILIGMQFSLAWLAARNNRFQQLLVADPQLLYYKGVFIETAMKQTRISENEIYQSARSQGIQDMKSVSQVILESNGNLSVIRSSDNDPSDLMKDVDIETIRRDQP